jgi:hypothetical protein
MWVTSLRIEYTFNGQDWLELTPPDKNSEYPTNSKWFKANKDRDSIVEIKFPKVLKYPMVVRALQIRLYPMTWINWPCLRFEAYYHSS